VKEQTLEERIEELNLQILFLREKVDTMAAGVVDLVTEAAPEAEKRRIEELTARVESLQKKVDDMAAGVVTMVTEVVPEAESAAAAAGETAGRKPDDLVAWAGTSSLLPRVSTLCFVLVVALALRTVTDSGILEKHIGSVVGMIYAAAIMVIGWLRYRKGSSIAPVFSFAGAILMFTIIIETHSRFGSLPTVPAYLLLLGTGLAMAYTGRAAGSLAPMVVGILGMSAAGVAVNFPVPSLPLLALLLFAANVVAFLAAPEFKRDWLRWVLFGLTGAVFQVWAYRAEVILLDPDFPSPPLHPEWFIPWATVFGFFFFAGSIYRMFRSVGGKKMIFDYVVPTAAAVVFFSAARHVAVPLRESGLGIGIFGAAAATAHLGVASLMVRGKKLSALEFNAFTFAGVVLLVLSLSAATGALLVALPLLSAAAFHLAVISQRWESGGTRLISYFLQVFVALTLAGILLSGQTGVPPFLGGLGAAVVGTLALLHYRWSRRQAPPADSVVFARLDRKDIGGVSLLLASLVGWFFLLRTGAEQILLLTGAAGDVGNSLSGIQSLLINAAAIIFLVLSYTSRNRELRNVALLITLVGAAKVFLYDLVGVEGVPRVLSVFSFGFVAAIASYVLGRWQSGERETGEGNHGGA
jgi:hypothetical protein